MPAPAPAPTPAPAEPPKPAKWEGRVMVPGAAAPGQKKAAGPVAPTAVMAQYAQSGATAIQRGVPPRPSAPAPLPARPRRRSSGGRRFFVALFALILILAVPVVSAYVSYKLASGENPFVWPPTMDLSHTF
jgi:hypothetical protein